MVLRNGALGANVTPLGGNGELYVPTQADRIENTLNDVKGLLGDIRTLLKMSVLASAAQPVTSIVTSFAGSQIAQQTQYFILFRNATLRPRAFTVSATFSTPGQVISLSLTVDPSRAGEIDILANNGKVISTTIWLEPSDTLYIANRDPVFDLTGARFRLLAFDPLSKAAQMAGPLTGV